MKKTATAWNLALAGLVAVVCMALAAPLVRADGYIWLEAGSNGRYDVGIGYSSDDGYYDDGRYGDDAAYCGNDYGYGGGWYEDDLAPYGRWRYIDALRTEVWFPYVGPEWRPYTDGHWIDTKHGWTWVAYEPWGEIPHHFGRWVYLKRVGWGWVPGDEWGPAWVTWSVANGHIGWTPLPPVHWVYNDRFDYDYCGNVDYRYGGDYGYHRSGLDFGLWVFVSNGRFYDTHVSLNFVSGHRAAGWFRAGRVLPIGPRLHKRYVSRWCATPIRTVVIERHYYHYGDRRIASYKPHGQTHKIKERGRYGVYTKRQPVYRASSKRQADYREKAKITRKSGTTYKRSNDYSASKRSQSKVTRSKSNSKRDSEAKVTKRSTNTQKRSQAKVTKRSTSTQKRSQAKVTKRSTNTQKRSQAKVAKRSTNTQKRSQAKVTKRSTNTQKRSQAKVTKRSTGSRDKSSAKRTTSQRSSKRSGGAKRSR